MKRFWEEKKKVKLWKEKIELKYWKVTVPRLPPPSNQLHHCRAPWVKFTAKSTATTTIHNLGIHFQKSKILLTWVHNFIGGGEKVLKHLIQITGVYKPMCPMFIVESDLAILLFQSLVLRKILVRKTHWHWKANLMDSIFGDFDIIRNNDYMLKVFSHILFLFLDDFFCCRWELFNESILCPLRSFQSYYQGE